MNSTIRLDDSASRCYSGKLGESLAVLGELGSTWTIDLTLAIVDQDGLWGMTGCCMPLFRQLRGAAREVHLVANCQSNIRDR